MKEFRKWLLTAIAECERIYDLPDPPERLWERATDIACEAGARASKLGLAELYKNSVAFGGTSDPPKVIAFLSECLAACGTQVTKSEMVGIREAAQTLNCSESGLRKLIRKKAIRFSQSKKHGTIRFRPEWLEEFIEHNSPNPGKKVSIGPTSQRRVHAPVAMDGQNNHGFDDCLSG